MNFDEAPKAAPKIPGKEELNKTQRANYDCKTNDYFENEGKVEEADNNPLIKDLQKSNVVESDEIKKPKEVA